MTAALAEVWLLLFLLCAGLGIGAAAVLALGVLLAEAWADPLRPVLAPLARALPVLGLGLLVALPWAAPLVYRADNGVLPGLLRAAAVLAACAALGWMVAAPAVPRWRAGVAAALLTLLGALAMEDWALSRDPGWTGSIQGVALLTGQAAAALSLATLAAQCDGRPRAIGGRTGLERTLLVLGLASLWFWFTQFVVVYAADIPAEAAWYVRRQGWPWAILKAVAVAVLLAAVALALLPQWRPWRFSAVASLLIVQHLAHLLWLVRPEAAPGAASLWLDGAVLLALPLAVLAVARQRRRPASV